jgi:WD40 repeat protein
VLASSRVSSGANPHGIKKISLANPAATEEIPIHVDAIRDIKVSPTDDTIVLTASNDKTVCILNTATKNVIMTCVHLGF